MFFAGRDCFNTAGRALFLLVLLVLNPWPRVKAVDNDMDMKLAKEKTADLFYHGYQAYMKNAYPADELKPLTCSGDNGMFGGLFLTLVDSLDMLAVMKDSTEFTKGLWLVVDNLNFDKDKVVSVFEINIRILGGLLSSHVLAADESLQLVQGNRVYNGELLDLAEDLGSRLLPAFDTPTGIPYGSINLRHGIASNESSVTCTAGGGSFLLEFGVLSRLTDDYNYEQAARRATHALWSRRSKLNLVGAHIDILTGKWTHDDAGIGTFVDSFYEYLLKSYIMFGKEEDLLMFIESYTAVIRYIKRGPWYVEAKMHSGNISWTVFSSLQGFWPGLQVLYGDINMASDSLKAFFSLCSAYSFPPERFNIKSIEIEPGFNGYPLRPEIIESAYYLYRATESQEWAEKGMAMLEAIKSKCKPENDCGVASIADVNDGSQENIMPSFFLAETCKYFYLLFDKNNFLHSRNVVFSTEGHPFPVGRNLDQFSRRSLRSRKRGEDKQHAATANRERPPVPLTDWERLKNSPYWSPSQQNAVEVYRRFAENPCPRHRSWNPLYETSYNPTRFEDFVCWPEEGRYVSKGSPPLRYKDGESPFGIIVPVETSRSENAPASKGSVTSTIIKYLDHRPTLMTLLTWYHIIGLAYRIFTFCCFCKKSKGPIHGDRNDPGADKQTLEQEILKVFEQNPAPPPPPVPPKELDLFQSVVAGAELALKNNEMARERCREGEPRGEKYSLQTYARNVLKKLKVSPATKQLRQRSVVENET
jgi:ER degradation enhancer, mannosidase alpha-like 2